MRTGLSRRVEVGREASGGPLRRTEMSRHTAHLPAVLEGLAQAKRRQFATDAEVEAAFRRFEQ